MGLHGICWKLSLWDVSCFLEDNALPMGLHGICWKHLLNYLGFGGVFYGETQRNINRVGAIRKWHYGKQISSPLKLTITSKQTPFPSNVYLSDC
ncbi:MAG: hypothetical protein ACXITR_01200 [Cyanobacterium sp.]